MRIALFHYDPDEDDEPEHGEDIELLGRLGGVHHGEMVDDREPREPADDGERDGEHDHQGVQETLEERTHQEVGHEERPHETRGQEFGVPNGDPRERRDDQPEQDGADDAVHPVLVHGAL